MAAPYTGQISGVNTRTGEVFIQPYTSTDVASSFWLFPNNGSNNFFTTPGKPGDTCLITDITTSTATSVIEVIAHLRVSGKDTGVAMMQAGLLQTVNNRVPQPIPIRGGSSVMIQVKTT